MRWHPTLTIALATAGCVTTTHSTDSVPSDLAVNRQWKSNADGYIFTVGYFTKEQIDSPEWETARVRSAATVQLCDNKEIVRRDVRWFEPIAPGEPQCAAVVYSFACTPRRPEWGSSLEYERRQAVLEGLPDPITANCGEKDGSRMAPVRIPKPSGLALATTPELCRFVLPDVVTDGFELRDVNYIQERTMASFHYVRNNRPLSGNPAGFLGQAAVAGQQLHFVISNRDLAHDRHNIFVDQVFTENGDGYCITFTARQGSAVWQRTIKRDSIPAIDIAMRGRDYHSNNPEEYWDADTDSHLLQHLFALELGLELPSDHPTDVSLSGPPRPSSEDETGQIHSDTPQRQVD
jgi:hypothetical protein